MTTDPHQMSCEDFHRASGLGRRGFLQGLAAATGMAVVSSVYGDTVMDASFGATPGNVLVVLSFRGGIDGLGMVVPHGDPAYYSARRSIAVKRESLVAQDAMFGLHPSMAPLLPMWRAGSMAAVHAVGMKVPNRSHFEAIELVEDADPGSSVRRGWVNRMIGLGGIVGPTEAVHVGSALTPSMLFGPAPTLAVDGYERLQLEGTKNGRAAQRYAGIQTVWAGTDGPLAAASRDAVTISKGFAQTMKATYRPSNGAVYPTSWPATDLSSSLRDAAALIRRNPATTVISIDYGSWDMHADYGTQSGGQMQAMVRGFAESVAAFFKDLGALGQRVTLATVSEFGRRVAENGNRGLDHGWGNMMLLLGGGVRGGAYYGRWPGLADGKLVAGDLAVTTDYRNVLGEVVATRFPDRSLPEVFPGLTYEPLGLMR
ncbi:DUF1501 domain-containing protein [Nocardioides marmoraquaticus]